MANDTTVNSELFTNLLAEAQFAAYENSVARQLVNVFDFPANAGNTLQVPVYSAVVANDLTEGVAPSAADTNTTSATIALSEIGTYFQVTDFLRDSAQRDVISDLGMNAGMAIAEKMDQGVFSLFPNFTNSIGVNTDALTVNEIFEAVSVLRSNKVSGPYYAVLSPRQALQVKKELATTGGANLTASEIGNSVLRGYYIGSVAGCQVFESSLVPEVSSLPVGAVFSPTAMGHAMRGSITLETERKAAARATDIMMTAVKGETILQNVHGVKLLSDAS